MEIYLLFIWEKGFLPNIQKYVILILLFDPFIPWTTRAQVFLSKHFTYLPYESNHKT